jgi:hypothetical protein
MGLLVPPVAGLLLSVLIRSLLSLSEPMHREAMRPVPPANTLSYLITIPKYGQKTYQRFSDMQSLQMPKKSNR